MTIDVIRTLVRWHAGLAWAATIVIGVVVAQLSAGRRPRSSAWLGVVLALAAALSGGFLDTPYRARLRQHLFLASTTLGWLFERKLHLAFGVAMLAVAGAASLAARGPRVTGDHDRASWRAALVAWLAAFLFAVFACVASVVVSRRLTF